MADLFEVLRTVHGDVRVLLAALENSPGHADGASQQVLRARKLAADRLAMDLARHETAEDEFFWPAVRERLGHGNELADEAGVRQAETRQALARLDQLPAADDEFDKVLGELIPAARRDMELEEAQVWPELRTALSPLQAREIGDQLLAATGHAADPPKGRKPAGSASAAADKLNGATSRRRAAN